MANRKKIKKHWTKQSTICYLLLRSFWSLVPKSHYWRGYWVLGCDSYQYWDFSNTSYTLTILKSLSCKLFGNLWGKSNKKVISTAMSLIVKSNLQLKHSTFQNIMTSNQFHNILKLFDVLPNFPFTTIQLKRCVIITYKHSILINMVYTSCLTSCRTT